MSTHDLVNFPHVPEVIYRRYRERNQVAFNGVHSISLSLSRLFSNAQRGDKLAQLIVYDFYLSINNEFIYKENITGKWIELKLSKLLALTTGDELRRTNPRLDSIMSRENQILFDSDTLNMVANNYREKGDLFFVNTQKNSLYKLSIKSLIPSNGEINIGAFEFKNSVRGIIGLEDLTNIQERNRTITIDYLGVRYSKIGMGSQSQLKNMLKFIKAKSKDSEYLSRLEILLRSVYVDDFLIYIKDNDNMKLYLIENEQFMNLIMEKIKNGFVGMRVEGNAIRVTGLNSFKSNALSKFEFTFDALLPDRYSIERLMTDSLSHKSALLRQFTS